MSLSPRRRHRLSGLGVVFAAFVMVLVSPAASLVIAGPEIPHENYDYVSSSTDIVVMILNSSIAYFEYSLEALFLEDTSGGSENLSFVRSLLDPAESLIDDIVDVAESYDDLSVLVPPFAELADEEPVFIGMETSLIAARQVILSLSGQVSLTDEEAVLAMTAMNEASALLSRMNASIDDMLESATDIVSLSVNDEYPFADNDLLELIERLRELLYSIEVELIDAIEGGGEPGGGTGLQIGPFLTLWVSDSSLYLGDDLAGGGYLFFNGSFRPGYDVRILWDGTLLDSATTRTFGDYGFVFGIPLNESWLGTHELVASSYTPVGNLTSDSVTVTVTLIPTSFVISLSSRLLAPSEQLHVSVLLRDVRGDGVGDSEFGLIMDGVESTRSTDGSGKFTISYSCEDLGVGYHQVKALFDGMMPYLPCSSPEVSFKIDLPTKLELNPFLEKVYIGYYLVGNGTLMDEGDDPLPGMTIHLLIDGVSVVNVTTDSHGVFSFSISTESMAVGTHVLRAEYVPDNETYRPSEDEKEFRIYSTERSGRYPFWPIIPGWPRLGAPPEIAMNLFFGEHAYFGWLLIIGVVAVIIKTLRVRKRAVERRQRLAIQERSAHIHGASDSVAQASEFADAFDLIEPPDAPNERIVWAYNYFLDFLARKRNIQIRSSMTHREIAGMLQAFGYPSTLVDKVTTLFEMARYAGVPMSESEMNTMGSTIERLKSTVLGGRAYAA